MADVRQPLPDEQIPEAHLTQTFYEQGPKAGQAAAGSTKVGFTLRTASGRVVDAMSFLINPQGLDRALGSRSTLTATQAAFLVDNFGPAPGTIQLRQLVASGKDLGRPDGLFYTAREDVQRFLKTIYLPAMAPNGSPRHVYFHDHHLERGFEERVFFPAGSLQIGRGVELHNVWRLDLQMISLEKNPFGELVVQLAGTRGAGRSYVVRRGDSLTSIITSLAGKYASAVTRSFTQRRLIAMNPWLAKKRHRAGDPAGTTNAKPMKVYPGEVLQVSAT